MYNARKYDTLSKPIEHETKLFLFGSFLVLLIFWPLVLVGFALDPWITSIGYWLDRRRNRFACKSQHLLASVSVTDAEDGARIIDPLHRVPNLPFGHLNPTWHEFLQKKRAGCRLWKFTIPGNADENDPQWSTRAGGKVGYAWVRWRRVQAEFVYEWD
jgi:hypothetical protein